MGSRTFRRVAFAAGVALFLMLMPQGCGDPPTLTFSARLDGSQEVPSNASAGSGQVVITLDRSGTSLTYTLSVDNIRNVFMAHLHSPGAPGVNAGIVLFLYGPVPAAGGPTSGVIATGTKTGADLIGPLAGHPLSDLIDSIKAGTVYANVHTSAGPGNPSGPGNLPGGEVRGQVIIRPQ